MSTLTSLPKNFNAKKALTAMREIIATVLTNILYPHEKIIWIPEIPPYTLLSLETEWALSEPISGHLKHHIKQKVMDDPLLYRRAPMGRGWLPFIFLYSPRPIDELTRVSG